jgi:hypothetical protein
LTLDVRTTLAAEATSLESGDLLRLPSHDFRRIALALRHDWGPDEIVEAVHLARLSPDDVVFVVTAEDGFMKERIVLGTPCRLADVAELVKLADYNGNRADAMRNSAHGFQIDAHIVLSRTMEPVPFRPHRLGTILARSTFKLRPSLDTGGLDPEPLTKELIGQYGLSERTVLYVHSDDDLIGLEQLYGHLHVYVHERLLAAASHQRGPDRDAVIGGLAVEALCQLVHAVSAELRSGAAVPPDDASAVLRLLRRNLKIVGEALEVDEFVDQVRDDPRRIAGLLSGLDGRAQRLLQLVEGDDEGAET